MKKIVKLTIAMIATTLIIAEDSKITVSKGIALVAGEKIPVPRGVQEVNVSTEEGGKITIQFFVPPTNQKQSLKAALNAIGAFYKNKTLFGSKIKKIAALKVPEEKMQGAFILDTDNCADDKEKSKYGISAALALGGEDATVRVQLTNFCSQAM